MKSLTTIVIFLMSFFFFSCSPKAQTKVETSVNTSTIKAVANPIEVLSSADFKQKIEASKVQLVDIRTAGEFNQAHIKGSINYDFYQRTFMSQMNTLDKSKPIYIYCRSGSRSRSASNKLKKVGFTKIYDLKGGINYWSRAGFQFIK